MFLASLLALSLMMASPEGIPPLGIIDFYGLRTISEGQARRALGIKEGDAVTADAEAAQRRLEMLPGIARARVQFTCCEGGKSLLYVGVQEKGSPALKFHKAPTGKVRLPDEILRAGEAFEAALTKAVLAGDAGEEWSQGHSLARNAGVRAIQERFIVLADRNRKRLRTVLRDSGDPRHRELAAEVLAYGSDKKAVAADLGRAVLDADGAVRNNAIRALMILAVFAQTAPERGISISPKPFIKLLDSVEWSDRNKSMSVLDMMTLKRDPALLSELRRNALPALMEMARWKSPDHAKSAFTLLGRIGGLTEEEMDRAWQAGDRERTIRAAERLKRG